MPVTPTYPGVYIEELPSSVHTIAGVATSITAFVGYTSRGIDNRAQTILSFSDYERLFGGIAADSELSYAVQHFFQNGGAQGIVVRVPRTGAAGAQVVFSNLRFSALSSGAWANGTLVIDVDVNGVNSAADATAFNLTITNLEDGTVESFPALSLSATRSNYVLAVVNDPDTGSQLVNVATAGALPATAPQITGTVGANLVQATLDTTVGGAAASAVATGDFGVQLSVAAPVPAPLPLNIKVFAQGGPIPQTVAGLASQLERTLNAALAVQWPGASVRCAAVAGTAANTQRITVSGFFPGLSDAILTFAAPAAPLGDAAAVLGLAAPSVANVAHYSFGTGHAAGGQTLGRRLDGTALPGTALLIGDQLSFTGIYALRKVDLFNLLCIPDATRASAGNPSALDPAVDPNSIYSRGDQPVPRDAGDAAGGCAAERQHRGVGGRLEDQRACRAPGEWRRILPAPAAARSGEQLPTAHLRALRRGRRALRAYRRHARRVEGAGRHRGDADRRARRGLQAERRRERRAQPARAQLPPQLPGVRPVVWGARTLVGADAEGSQWKYVPVRRLALYHRGEPLPRHQVGGVRAERRAAVVADPAEHRRLHARPVPPGRLPGQHADATRTS